MKYYIYFLKDPRTDDIRYVGCTQNIQKRLRKHIFDVVNQDKIAWMKELRGEGFTGPKLEVWDVVECKGTAKAIEENLIRMLDGLGYSLLNKYKLRPMDEEHRKKISKSVKEMYNKKKEENNEKSK